MAGWVISVRRRRSSGPSKQTVREFVAEGFVGFFEGLARDGIFLRQLFAHADGLRSLAGEEKGNAEEEVVMGYSNAKVAESRRRPQPEGTT